MRNIKVRLLLLCLLITVGTLNAQYLDVGNDPSKIKARDIKKIDAPAGYTFGEFSPDGQYFTMNSGTEKAVKSIILNKNGQSLQSVELMLQYWLPDCENLLAIDSSDKIWVYNFKTKKKAPVNLDLNTTQSLVYHEYSKEFFYIKKGTGDIFAFNHLTGKKRLICKTGFKDMPIAAFSKNYLLMNRYYDKEGSSQGDILKIKIDTGEIKKLCTHLSSYPIFVHRVKAGYVILYVNDGTIYLIDEKGKLLTNKMKINIFESDEYESVDFVWIISHAISPNGKILALEVCIESAPGESYNEGADSDEYGNIDFYAADVLTFNYSGEWKCLVCEEDKKEYIDAWSPLGDTIIYNDGGGVYYLAKIEIVQ